MACMIASLERAARCRVSVVLLLVLSVLHSESRAGPGPSRRSLLRQAHIHRRVVPRSVERVTWDNIVNREIPVEAYQGGSELSHFNSTRWYGSLHDVVGEDGVVLIHVDNLASEGTGRSGEGLVPVGILATPFAATDARNASSEELRQGCISSDDHDSQRECPSHSDGGRSSGCGNSVEQAIADSHRRALLLAEGRESDWTAILEDDALPVTGDDATKWSDAFASVWPHVPEKAKLVRLGWCTFEEDVGPITSHVLFDGGVFKILSGLTIGNGRYYAGGCTTGYLVHRSIIPRLLDIFPCCSPIDTCLEEEFFYQPAGCRDSTTCEGNTNMVSIDAVGSTGFASGRTFLQGQSGILVQDNPMFTSSRQGLSPSL